MINTKSVNDLMMHDMKVFVDNNKVKQLKKQYNRKFVKKHTIKIKK